MTSSKASDRARKSSSGLMSISDPRATKHSTTSYGASGVPRGRCYKDSTLTMTRQHCQYATASKPVRAARFRTRPPQPVVDIDAQHLQCWFAENDNIVVDRYDSKRKRIHGDPTLAGAQSNPHRACSFLDLEHTAIRHLELPRVRHAPHNLHIRKCRS